MFFIKRITILMIGFICFLINSNAWACELESKTKPWVILLNGSSSVGKSTITKVFVEKYPELKPAIIKFDDLLENALFEKMQRKTQELGISATIREEMQSKLPDDKLIECYQAVADQQSDIKLKMRQQVRDALNKGQNVIIDTVIGDEDYNNTVEWFAMLSELSDKFPVFCVLVYCPLNLLSERVKSRNANGNLKEQRNLESVIELFGCMYKSGQNLQIYDKKLCPCIDSIKQDNIQKIAVSCSSLISDSQQFFKRIMSSIKIGWNGSGDIPLYPKFAYDKVLKNDGTQTPASLAKELYNSLQDFLKQSYTPTLQINERLARYERSSSYGR